MGATRQLLTYRQVRQPDVATGAFWGTVVAGLVLAVLAQPLLAVGIPAGLTLAGAARHVSSRFELARSSWFVASEAVVVDSVLLVAYFFGRLAGLRLLWRRLPAGQRLPDGPAREQRPRRHVARHVYRGEQPVQLETTRSSVVTGPQVPGRAESADQVVAD
jgi:hypothetical protein